MPIGDGIRRDIATVSPIERARFIDAIVKLDTTKFFPDGVSYWDKQEDIHKNAHFSGVDVHFGPAFISWHRVIVNRLEGLLREVDPELSLHYWDWTTDPRVGSGTRAALFTPEFIGNANGDAGHLLTDFESSEDAEIGNGHTHIWREVGAQVANPDGTPAIATDASILSGTNFASFGTALKSAHDNVAHSYIGGTIIAPHYSFHDPFVFLLHSNLDRLWARWQTDPAHTDRMDTSTAYAGLSPADLTKLATEHVEPWAGGTGLDPWASDPTKRAVITYTDITIVTPPCYDTNQSTFGVLEAENPWNAATSRHQVVFNDVPEEETTWRAAVIRGYSCEDVTIRVKPGEEPGVPFSAVSGSDTIHHGPSPFGEARIWFQFTAGAVGTAPQTIPAVNTTLQCVETGEEFPFELRGNTIHRPTVVVELALDQSGSMADPAGTSGATRLQVLKDAASLFADLIPKNDGLGLIRFDDDAYPPNDPTYGGMAVTKVLSDDFSDGARLAALSAIAAHGAHGNTSVGDGLEMARAQLNAVAPGDYDDRALLLLTDGLENTPKWISEVSSSIDDRTYAVGLGNESQVNTYALSALAGSTGGYLLLSGLLSSSLDDQFRLRKFFLQILAGITKTSIVEDPVGYVGLGSRLRIPFTLSEADITCRVILLTQLPLVRLALETPDGRIVDEGSAAAAGVTFDTAGEVRTARFGLPTLVESAEEQGGTWHALLEVDDDVEKWLVKLSERHQESLEIDLDQVRGRGVPFCLTVHSFSNLRMVARIGQSGFTPGSTISLRAVLTEYTLPVDHRAKVRVEVEHPDRTNGVIWLNEVQSGVFTASFSADSAGIYRLRVVAEGGTFRGLSFTREQLGTAAVWIGGDRPTQVPGGDDDWCRLISCLLDEKILSPRLQARLKKEGFSLPALRECLDSICGRRRVEEGRGEGPGERSAAS
jgi:hypothetical protein